MASLKDIRNRITSVKSTQQITSAMKMVSAAKLRKAQDRISQMRPYALKLKETMGGMIGSVQDLATNPLVKQNEKATKALIIVVTSNRGLCGAFNANVIKEANRLIKDELANFQVEIITIGKKGFDGFKKSTFKIIENASAIYDDLTFTKSNEIADTIMSKYKAGEYASTYLVYNMFKNAATHILSSEILLPIQQIETTVKNSTSATDYLYDPDQETIVQELLPKAVKIQLYKAILDSNAAEQGARMTAMHKATDNAGELIKSLNLQYNKARQASITNEILEIVGGAEALNG